MLKISFPKDAALLNRNMSYRVAILSSSCGHVNPNLHCSPPQHWQAFSISSPLLLLNMYQSKAKCPGVTPPKSMTTYQAGGSFSLLYLWLTHYQSSAYELLQYETKLHVLSNDWYPPSENWGVLDSNPCPDFWVDNAQSPFFVLFYIYILGWNSYWTNETGLSQGGEK